jgi:formate hydrogenlyase transcriptional activator
MASLRHGFEDPGDVQDIRLVVDTIPTLAWSAGPDGSADFHNQRWLDYTGLSAKQALDWGWKVAIHPDDLPRILETVREALNSVKLFEVEGRFRRFDGEFRWFLFRGSPLRDQSGKVAKWYGTNTDLEERKRAEDALRKSEERWRSVFENSAIGVALTDLNGRFLATNHVYQTIVGYTEEELRALSFLDVTHEDYREANWTLITELLEGKRRQFQIEKKYRRKDGSSIWVSNNVSLVPGTERVPQFIMALSEDITQRKRAEEALRSHEQNLRLLVDTIPGLVVTTTPAGEIEHLNRQVLEYFGKTTAELKDWATSDALHPDDLPLVIDAWRRSVETGYPFDFDHRLRRADGVYRWFHSAALPLTDTEGRITGWYMLLTDIDDRKRAEEKLRQDERELRQIVDTIAQLVVFLSPEGDPLFANRFTLDYTGLSLEELKAEGYRTRVFHPDDVERLREERQKALLSGIPFENEQRARRSDGQYRWFFIRYNALLDEQGCPIRWYAAGIDIEDRKQAEERTRQENFALREQIDQVFMLEEIVGSSPALKTVLSSIVKVAPSDSTVLITGETGTGKELVARAIHKGSQRAGQPFITVNCAAVPASLIASELFGHEKGAFTGALQQRQGRFELAHSGTIFLDEIGELPGETQIALLRVLQERQFERVGGSRVISTDVRVIAATNRDLAAAIASGIFRADLFYRLNVFPIHMPPLRNRKEDIPMLVEYFVKRYAGKARKQISKIDKNTLKLCQSYPWPGNIRELQNIIERSVIVCTGDTLWIDEAWLSSQDSSRLESSGPLVQTVQNYEKKLIEAALAECNGKIAGPNGAAAKLGIPRSTLDLKIKQLNIKKNTIR